MSTALYVFPYLCILYMLILIIDDIRVCNMQIAIHTWMLLRSVKSLLKERDQVVISPGSLTIFFLKEFRFFSFLLAYSYKFVIIFCQRLIFISFLENYQLSMVLNRFFFGFFFRLLMIFFPKELRFSAV